MIFPILANYFLRVYCEKYNREPIKINTHALEKLTNYSWPGNVRELQHAIEKAVIMSDSPVLLPSDFEFRSSSGKVHHDELTLAEMEKKMILDCLKRHGNNISVAAAKLGITRQTLYNKLKKLDSGLTLADYLTVEQVHNPVSITCIPVVVSNHNDSGTLFIKFRKQVDHFNTIL